MDERDWDDKEEQDESEDDGRSAADQAVDEQERALEEGDELPG